MEARVVVAGAIIFLAVGFSNQVLAQGHHGHGKGNRHHEKHGGGHKNHERKRNLSDKIYKVTQADSLQKIKMKPLVDKTAKRMESLRASYQKEEVKALDSLRAQLKPILKEEQFKKLEEFKSRLKK